MDLAPTGGPGLGWWVPHVGDRRCFSFGWKQLTAVGRLSLPPTPLSPPIRPITSINSQATLHLHRQLLLASCAHSTAVDRCHGPQGEAKGKHPVGKLPSSLLVVGKLLAKKTLLLILIGEIDLDFVFLIYVHCMLQSSGGSDAPPASTVWHSGYPSPPAKWHCPGIDPAASAVPPPLPPPPPPQGSCGDGPSHRAPSLPLL